MLRRMKSGSRSSNTGVYGYSMAILCPCLAALLGRRCISELSQWAAIESIAA